MQKVFLYPSWGKHTGESFKSKDTNKDGKQAVDEPFVPRNVHPKFMPTGVIQKIRPLNFPSPRTLTDVV